MGLKIYRIIFYVALCFLFVAGTKPALSQPEEILEGDSTEVLQNRVILDSSYLHKDIFSLLRKRDFIDNSEVWLRQSSHVGEKVKYYIQNASQRSIRGYRIRIFFDNRQDARSLSEEIEKAFSEDYPGVGVYRIYENPYFKVTVGDIRSKSEAVKFLGKLEKDYPAAFIVREDINFPPL